MADQTTSGLIYPSPEDAAAMGPNLRRLALGGDAAYCGGGTQGVLDFANLDRFQYPPGIVTAGTGVQAAGAANNPMNPSFSTIMFDNVYNGSNNDGTVVQLPVLPDGRTLCWFLIGAWVQAVLVGAVTANSLRQLTATVTKFDPITGVPSVETFVAKTYADTTTQPNSLWLEAMVSAYSGTVSFSFVHQNAASNMNLAAGRLRWIHRVAPPLPGWPL